MYAKHCVALSLLLASATAIASEQLPTVEVRAETEKSLFISCKAPKKPSAEEIIQVLNLASSEQVRSLTPKLMRAAAEGCEAGIARIVVTPISGGTSLSWTQAP